MPDVIVTGLPRSGATVVAALIDYLPRAVCFNSPAAHIAYARKQNNALPYGKWLAGDFIWRRAQLQRRQPLPDFRAADGSPFMDGQNDPKQPRNESGKAAHVLFTRAKLEGDFILGMKHHVLYTALLPALVKFDHFKIIAVIRHPLDVLASWQKLGMPPLARGNPPGIGRLWPEALAIAEAEIDPIDRMVQLYDLHLQRYHELGEQVHIVKYEDVAHDPMTVSRLFGIKTRPANASMIEKRKRVHRVENAALIRESLRKYGVFAREYYGDI